MAICLVCHYGRRLLRDCSCTHRKIYEIWLWITVGAILLDAILITMVRSHYSVDILLGLVVTPTVYRLHFLEFGDDPGPVTFLPEFRRAPSSVQ